MLNGNLLALCSYGWFPDVKQLFDLTSTVCLVSSNNLEGIDTLFKQEVDTDVLKELVVSFKKPNVREQEI